MFNLTSAYRDQGVNSHKALDLALQFNNQGQQQIVSKLRIFAPKGNSDGGWRAPVPVALTCAYKSPRNLCCHYIHLRQVGLMVSTRAFFILLPLLVQGAPADSGNREGHREILPWPPGQVPIPEANTIHTPNTPPLLAPINSKGRKPPSSVSLPSVHELFPDLHPAPPPTNLNHQHDLGSHTQPPRFTNVHTPAAELKDIDKRLRATKITTGSLYVINIEEGTFAIPIPTDDYYRVPLLNGVFETPAGKTSVLLSRVFRSFDVHIPEARITILRTLPIDEIHVLPIDKLLATIPISNKNTRDLDSLTIPLASKYRLNSGTNEISIGLNKYIQIRAAATITTLVGTFRTKADRVVCSVEYVGIETLERYRKRCSESYDARRKKLEQSNQTPDRGRDAYVEECTLNLWSNYLDGNITEPEAEVRARTGKSELETKQDLERIINDPICKLDWRRSGRRDNPLCTFFRQAQLSLMETRAKLSVVRTSSESYPQTFSATFGHVPHAIFEHF
ncbi:hypothetical protein APHAL10511_002312 [Amanita phalloides]|nr:hypothetical protein APHAL10511_002312 [Amanita phalloides]